VKRSHARDLAAPDGAGPQVDLAGALHEVSNALTVVLGWLDAARVRVVDGPPREALEVARSHADLAYRVARAAIGARVATDVERSAFSVARDAILGVTQEARRQGVRLELDDERAMDSALCDSVVAYQVLINLLLNALAFTPVGGTVGLVLQSDPMRMVFRVTDQGPGIDAERAASIFDGPGSTRTGGAGIGLKHSAALARERGGELRLVQAGPGATFELCWPVREAHSGAHQRLRESSVSLGGLRVLVIEDDPAVSSLIEFALETHGVHVFPAARQEQMVALLREHRFDAALVDLSPFENDAGEALELLDAAVADGASLILISGLVTRLPPVLEGRIAAWVRKPFEMNEVVQVLRQLPRRAGE
jgi:CheY-like chemotaxis protein